MSAPRDYKSFLSLLSVLVPVNTQALKSDRSVGGYLALRVAADQYLHNGKFAFDIDFFRDEAAEGGVTTRLMEEPTLEIAKAHLVGMYAKTTVDRFLTKGLLDLERIRIAMTHDEMLRVKHGEKITLERAGLNAIALMRGQIPSLKPVVSGPAQEFELPSIGMRR